MGLLFSVDRRIFQVSKEIVLYFLLVYFFSDTRATLTALLSFGRSHEERWYRFAISGIEQINLL